MESCEHYEQVLALVTGNGLPEGGIVTWADARNMRTMFATRAGARAAIDRTEHYRLAFGRTDLPEKKYCSVVPVAALTPDEAGG